MVIAELPLAQVIDEQRHLLREHEPEADEGRDDEERREARDDAGRITGLAAQFLREPLVQRVEQERQDGGPAEWRPERVQELQQHPAENQDRPDQEAARIKA